MLIQLAPEYWMEIFDFLIQHRRVVAEKISQFGDRQFSDLCQHWLHERVKNVLLDCLNIRSNGMMKACSDWEVKTRTNVLFAQSPMPLNIVGFKEIEINYLDSNVLTFVHRMSSLFTNIRLNIDSGKEEADAKNALIAFEHLLPLFNGINQIYLSGSRPFFERFRKQFPSALLNRVRRIVFGVTEGLLPDDYVQFIANLLHTKRENGEEPRTCTVIGFQDGGHGMSVDQLNKLLAIIREDFLGATTPTSFIFNFYPSSPEPINAVQGFHIDNDNTGEQLLVLKEEEGKMLFIIRCRCPSVDVPGLFAWTRQHNIDCELQSDRIVTIFRPEIGELGEEDPKAKKQEETDDDQPGPSKRPKMT